MVMVTILMLILDQKLANNARKITTIVMQHVNECRISIRMIATVTPNEPMSPAIEAVLATKVGGRQLCTYSTLWPNDYFISN